jgi:hypothetical protein
MQRRPSGDRPRLLSDIEIKKDQGWVSHNKAKAARQTPVSPRLATGHPLIKSGTPKSLEQSPRPRPKKKN